MSNKPLLKALAPLLRALFLLAVLAPLAYAVYRQWGAVRQALTEMSIPLALLGWLTLAVAQPLMGMISWMVLRRLNQHFPFLRIASVYFVSQAAKYLPGGIWAFPGRVVAYQAIGVPRAASVVSLVQEVAALFLGAAAFSLVGLMNGMQIDAWMRTALMVGIAACMVGILVAQHPRVWKLFSKVGLKQAAGDALESRPGQFSLAWLPGALAPALLFWALVGLGFRWLVISIDPQAAQLTFWQAAGIFSLAWCAGFVVVIAPAGLGVREAALTALLLPYLSSGQALSIALAARLWWTLGEALFILLSVVLGARKVSLSKPETAGLDTDLRRERG
jgi:uncharacterized membrane protein YbhN (UPF0104 family)